MRLRALLLVVVLAWGASAAPPALAQSGDADRFMIVDCLLPGQVRRLGSQVTYLSARKAIKTSAAECEQQGGEYVLHDRATKASALKIWMPRAEEGDLEAMVYVGEIHERGLGERPDHAQAAKWYFRAAEKGSSRGAMNLGSLFERGLGVAKDPKLAAFWFQKASGIPGIRYETNPSQPNVAPAPTPAATGDKLDIIVVEPELVPTRGVLRAKMRSVPKTIVVVGQVRGDDIAALTVNGQKQRLMGGNMFRATVPAAGALNGIELVAEDQAGRKGTLTFFLGGGAAPEQSQVPTGPIGTAGAADVGPGAAHALVVGINTYRDEKIPDLDTAVNDAKVIADLLRRDYGFKVTLLTDADRYAILSQINELRRALKPEDRLLIYYAGHGELDRANRRGHWLPADAEPRSTVNWISNVAVTDMLNAAAVRQVLVIADSCYSGAMSRAAIGQVDVSLADEERLRKLRELAGARVRTVMTSGGVQPVLDSAGGKHSVFAQALIDVLKANRGVVTGEELFRHILPRVQKAAAAVDFDQAPEYGPLQFAGHEAGDFVLARVRGGR